MTNSLRGKSLDRIFHRFRQHHGSRKYSDFTSLFAGEESIPELTLSRAFVYIRPVIVRIWYLILLIALFTVGAGVIGLVSPYLSKLMIDRGIIAGEPQLVVYFGVLILISYLFSTVMRTIGQIISASVSNRFILDLKKLILVQLLKLPIEFFDRQRSGYLAGRVNEPDTIAVLFSPSVFQPISSIVEAVGAFIIMTTIGGTVILLIVPFVFVIFFTTLWLNRKFKASTHSLMDSSARTAGGLQEIVFGITDLKNYDFENRKLKETIEQYKDIANKRMKQSVVMAIGMNILGFFNNIFSVAVMVTVGIYVANGSMTLGDYMALTGYALKILVPAQVLGNLSMTFQPAFIAMKRLGIVFDLDTEKELWGEKKALHLEGNVKLKGVSFGYRGTENKVLRNCDLIISHGECVAIIGKNGSGKTTIFKLLLGSYNNYTGGIYIDNMELHEYDITSLRSRIGLVSQNAFFFTGTLLDNIKMAAISTSPEEVKNVSLLSGCPQLFKGNLENVRIEENGKNLSGGQRQAAAIARCLLKKPDVLLFDEATTHLDQDTRQIIIHAIRDIFMDKTRIIITHDREVAGIADRIIILENGSLKELPHLYSQQI